MKLSTCMPMIVAVPIVSATLLACGPSHVELDPRNVVNIHIAPATKQPTFCPGKTFKVEIIAKLKDGTSCSSTDRARGCMGKKDAIIDPHDVRIVASSGQQTGRLEGFLWVPDPNPLKTAATGIKLRGWLEKVVGGASVKSIEGEADIRPVYDCQKENVFSYPQPKADGSAGRAGPNLVVAITTLSTPYYPDAALIRVEYDAERVYLISQSADQAVRILAKGQAGARGTPGTDGKDGAPGSDAENKRPCERGGNGQDGTDGGPGGVGGDGGTGGSIRVLLDDAAADKLRGRVLLGTPGGEPGMAGRGGRAGRGGPGGAGGPPAANCKNTRGESGKNGQGGAQGTPGKAGPEGSAAAFETAARKTLFATELSILSQIEATPAKR